MCIERKLPVVKPTAYVCMYECMHVSVYRKQITRGEAYGLALLLAWRRQSADHSTVVRANEID